MSGINRLKKGDRPEIEKEAEQFIKGAVDRTSGTKKINRQRTYQRYTFSLTPTVSADIDQLSLVSREFRVSRSEVVKAGIEALKALPENEVIKKLIKVKKVS